MLRIPVFRAISRARQRVLGNCNIIHRTTPLLQRRPADADKMISLWQTATPGCSGRLGMLRHYSVSGVCPAAAATVPITYIEPNGTERTVDAEIGKNLMQVAHDNNIELEGACGGELACSTCHLIFEDKKVFDTLPKMEEEEVDMLDLAFEVTETSRLGCQIKVREDFAGIKVRIPNDGFN